MSARTILKHLHQQGRMTDYQFDVINRNLKERPQGHWIIEECSLGKTYYCSECYAHPEVCFDFCPYCGADMRGGRE